MHPGPDASVARVPHQPFLVADVPRFRGGRHNGQAGIRGLRQAPARQVIHWILC